MDGYGRYPADAALLGNLVGLVLLVAIVAILVLAWCAVKATELVVRVVAKHPRNKAMGVALGSVLLLATLVLLTAGRGSW